MSEDQKPKLNEENQSEITPDTVKIFQEVLKIENSVTNEEVVKKEDVVTNEEVVKKEDVVTNENAASNEEVVKKEEVVVNEEVVINEEVKSSDSNSDDSDSSASLSSSVSSNSSEKNAPTSTVAQVSSSNTVIAANNDEFANLQKAVEILGKAKTLDEMKKHEEALKLYREGVDMLLEELIVRQGTDQSRGYLRQKCNDFMNRIDQLKLIIQIENQNKENKENQA